MAIKVRIVDERFFAELNNGSSFSLNTSDVTSHLKAGVLERLKASFTIQVLWTTTVNTFWINYDGVSQLIINDNGADFVADGFAIGDDIKISFPAGTLGAITKVVGVVQSITGGNMTVVSVTVPIGALPAGITQFSNEDSYVTGLTDLTALKYKFGLIENNESFNTLSKLTNTDQQYLADSIDHGVPLTYSVGTSFGNNKAWVSGSFEVAFAQRVLDEDLIHNEATTQEFIVNHEFVVNPVFRDGEEDSVKGIDVPPLDIFNGNKSLKYAFESEFRTLINNPNTSKIGIFDQSSGSVGYLDESFNGFGNDYTISDLTYTDVFTSGTISEIDANTTTRVNFSINGTGLMANGTPIVVGHTSIIDSTVYGSSAQDYDSLWLNETLRNTTGASFVNGTIIKGYTANLISADKVDIEFSIVFTAPQKLQISQGQQYLLYCNLQDQTLNVNDGNKVQLRVESSNYAKSTDISGLLTASTFEQYPHPETYTQGVTIGATTGKMFIEDGQFCSADLRLATKYTSGTPELPSSQADHDVKFNSLKFKIVAYNTVDGTWFDLREVNIDLSGGTPVLVGSRYIYNYNLNSTRGYILESSDIFNYLRLTTGTNFGTTQQYWLELGYKIPWQEWLELIGADTLFYDNAEPHNNLNNNSSNYPFSHNYKLRFLIDAAVETNSIVTNYVISSGDFESYDYETDDISPDGYTCDIKTFDINDTDIGGNIEEAYTKIEASFTPDAAIGDPGLLYGIIRLEPVNSPDDEGISEISTIIEAPTTSLLKQETGSSRLASIAVSGGAYVVTCLVDVDLIDPNQQYKISALIRAKSLLV